MLRALEARLSVVRVFNEGRQRSCAELLRAPLGRSSQYSTSRHPGEAFSTEPHGPKLGYVGQTLHARGFANATCCVLPPLIERECKGRGFGTVYCCPTAAKPSIIPLGLFIFLRVLQEKREPTSGLEPLTCSLRVMHQALQGFARGCKCRISKPYSFLRL